MPRIVLAIPIGVAAGGEEVEAITVGEGVAMAGGEARAAVAADADRIMGVEAGVGIEM